MEFRSFKNILCLPIFWYAKIVLNNEFLRLCGKYERLSNEKFNPKKAKMKNALDDRILGPFITFIWNLNENSSFLLKLTKFANNVNTSNKKKLELSAFELEIAAFSTKLAMIEAKAINAPFRLLKSV